jgi:mannosylglycerate hydrolase
VAGKKGVVLHLVPHTHWDREWYEPYQVFRLRLVSLIDKLLEIMLRQPEYVHFMLDGQTIVLEDYLEVRPEKRKLLRRFVQEGRIGVGPWYILPDEFLVSPEALIRNLSVGAATAAEFGDRMDVGYLPDPFGHIGQMPQILQGFGIVWAALRRGLDDQPTELWWEAPDGSSVLLAYLRDGYGNAAALPVTRKEFLERLRQLRDSLAPHSATNHILLLNGTDHHEAQPEIPELVAAASRRLDVFHDSLTAYMMAIQDADGDFPVVRGELRSPKRHHLLPGVLSARMWIKQRNHAIQMLLERWAEPFSTWATLLDDGSSTPVALDGRDPIGLLRAPDAPLALAWRLLLQNHPHDSICGCSIDQVHEEMHLRFDQVEQMGEQIFAQSLAFLAEQIDTHKLSSNKRSIPLIVFNPSDRLRTDQVTVQAYLPAGFLPLQLRDSDRQPVPVEIVEQPGRALLTATLSRDEFQMAVAYAAEGRLQGFAIQEMMIRCEDSVATIGLTLSDGEPDAAILREAPAQLEALLADPQIDRFVVDARLESVATIHFIARDVPPLGYKTYVAVPSDQPLPEPEVDGGTEIENEFLAASVDPDSGNITLVDKRTGQVFNDLNRFVDGGDRGDTYNYCPPPSDVLIDVPTNTRLDVTRRVSEVEQSLTFVVILRLPQRLMQDRQARLPLAAQFVGLPITVTLCLKSRVPRLDVDLVVINDAEDHRLRVHFPTGIRANAALFDGHFEVVRRPINLPTPEETQDWVEQPVPERPQCAFVTVHDKKRGLTLANRGLPEVAVLPADGGAEIALTLLRCVGWLSRSDFPCRVGPAGPEMATPGAQCHGEHAFSYSLIPHGSDPLPAWQEAWAYQTGLRALATTRHRGMLPPAGTLLQIEAGEHFVLSAVKSGGDQASLIVRGYSVANGPERVVLVPGYPFERAVFVRLDESPLDEPPLYPDSLGRFAFTIGPAQIVTLRFEL